MLITKNSYGVTSVFRSRGFDREKIGTCSGSSKERAPLTEDQFIQRLINKPLMPAEKKERHPKSMSQRTKTKIRRKVLAFAALHKHLTFVTLTFVNKVEDEQAVKILKKFLDNATKRLKNFQYLWVAEKQTENPVFVNNIHFHLITNQYWKIDKWWKYWIELQEKNGIVRRDTSNLPSSAFDVRAVNSNNVKAIGNYVTAYIVKNETQIKCQLWNCSKKISWLKTSMYSDHKFLLQIDALEKAGMLDGERKVFTEEYHTVHLFPLNKKTLKLYSKIDQENRAMWNEPIKTEKNVA
jgi:hypothetical protein